MEIKQRFGTIEDLGEYEITHGFRNYGLINTIYDLCDEELFKKEIRDQYKGIIKEDEENEKEINEKRFSEIVKTFKYIRLNSTNHRGLLEYKPYDLLKYLTEDNERGEFKITVYTINTDTFELSEKHYKCFYSNNGMFVQLFDQWFIDGELNYKVISIERLAHTDFDEVYVKNLIPSEKNLSEDSKEIRYL